MAYPSPGRYGRAWPGRPKLAAMDAAKSWVAFGGHDNWCLRVLALSRGQNAGLAVLFAEFALQELARGVARQGVHEHHLLGQLIGREVLPGVSLQRCFVYGLIRT
jgi:hypothetical protein